jgi:heme exporter protein B
VRPALALLRRDISLAFREGGAIGTALGFYLMVVAITPLGLGPDLNLLSRIAPGILWVALLLAALLSADRIFHNDYEDGTLDVLATGPLPLPLVAAIKSLAHWITTGVPLALLAPVLGLLLNLPVETSPLLVLTMLVGTPAVSFIAAIGASLTLGLRRSGMLLALLVLPLYVPVLIFGVGSVSAAITGPASPWPPLLMLTASALPASCLRPLPPPPASATPCADSCLHPHGKPIRP